MATKKKAAKGKAAAKASKKPAATPKHRDTKKSPAKKAVNSNKPSVKKSKPLAKKPAPKKAVKKAVAKKPVTKRPAAVKKAVVKKPQAKPVKSAGTKSVLTRQAPQKNIPNKTLSKSTQQQVQKTTPVVVTKPEMKVPYTGQTPQIRTMNVEKNTDTRSRYSDAELKEFKVLVERKLEDARAELINLNAAVINANENGTDDTGASFKMLEDGSDTLAKEESAQLAIRQKKFIEQLEAALQRIDNKTYGICRVTGKLIAKERLRAVPHTTQSMEAKLKQYRE